MSIEFGLGDAPPVAPPSLDLPGADDAGASDAPAGPAPELIALGETFGGDFTGFTSVADAERAALLIAQSYAQQGNVAPRQQPQPPANTQTSTNAPPATPEAEEDFGDLDPKVVARIKRLEGDLRSTRNETKQFQDRLAHEQYLLQQQQNQDVYNRAVAAIDALADPRYGVGGNRSYTQDLARESLLRTADRILNGMHGAGKNPPAIEKLISMAVLAESGQLPKPKAATGGGSNPAPPSRVGGGNTPQVPTIPKRKTGTEIDTYTADKEFMDGARAIVNRGRR